ncbi:MAG TPA: PQQ-binding-like beta-propeller repeat protein [Verrucomicrobiae bacterium]
MSPRTIVITAILSTFLSLLLTTVAADPSWTRFRGPNGSGVALNSAPPTQITTNNLAWKISIPPGHSSPIVSGNKLFLTAFETNRLVTLAFDTRAGRLLWRRAAPEVPIEPIHDFNSPATPTPVADAERLYVYFGSYGLICYDLDGRELWTKPIPTPKNLYGSASSPILHRDLLILVLDDDANLPDSKLSRSRLVAFHKNSGELAWETPRPLHRSGWSTPVIWPHNNIKDLLVLGSGRLTAYDPATGAEKWFVTGFARETTVVPVIGRDHIYASSAMGGIAEENPDLEPLWKAMLYFDANHDQKIATNEITEHFTFPLRPEVPPTHPGFGVPVPSDPHRRAERPRTLFNNIDKNRDGIWTREEFVANLGPRPFKPWLAAIRPPDDGTTGDITDTHIAWELRRSIPELPSPIEHQDRLYLVRNGGILTCINAATGQIIYDERLNAPGQYSASPVIARDHLYLISNNGLLTVVKTGDTFQPISQHDLTDRAFVSPALDQNTIFVRTKSTLQAFRSQSSPK